MGVASGISPELERALLNAWRSWRQEPLTGSKYVYFDMVVKDRYGIQLYQQHGTGWTGFDVIDEQKFTMFLLRWG